MTLEEAIQHLEESLSDKEWSCEACKEEHEQLLKWLYELKHFRELTRLRMSGVGDLINYLTQQKLHSSSVIVDLDPA